MVCFLVCGSRRLASRDCSLRGAVLDCITRQERGDDRRLSEPSRALAVICTERRFCQCPCSSQRNPLCLLANCHLLRRPSTARQEVSRFESLPSAHIPPSCFRTSPESARLAARQNATTLGEGGRSHKHGSLPLRLRFASSLLRWSASPSASSLMSISNSAKMASGAVAMPLPPQSQLHEQALSAASRLRSKRTKKRGARRKLNSSR